VVSFVLVVVHYEPWLLVGLVDLVKQVQLAFVQVQALVVLVVQVLVVVLVAVVVQVQLLVVVLLEWVLLPPEREWMFLQYALGYHLDMF
jgi:hypothetical protein